MTDELIEVQRIPLKDEDRRTLTQLVVVLKELRARYGEQSLPLHQMQRQVANLQVELEQLEEKTTEILTGLEGEIANTASELQACSKDLAAKYNVDPDAEDGSVWALNVVDGCFVQQKPAKKPKKSKKKPKKSKKKD